MYDVYSHAVINIAATAAASGDIGLFFSREARSLKPFNVDIAWHAQDTDAETPFQSFLCFAHGSMDQLINKSPLNQRAWVMQERHLSRRIVHYNRDEVFWECGESFVSETEQIRHPIESRSYSEWGTRDLKLLLTYHAKSQEHGNEEEPEVGIIDARQMENAWVEFRSWFAKCEITKDEDKLVAIAGVVKDLSNVAQDEFVAGFWRSRFLRELCWGILVPCDARRSSLWVAPTWSWATYTGRIFDATDYCVRWVDVAEIVSVELQTKISGALVEGGFLTVRCRSVAVRLHTELKAVTIRGNGHCHDMGDDKYVSFHNMYLDDDDFKVEHPEAILAVLREGWMIYPGPKSTVAGLILVPSANLSLAYERIGLFIGVRRGEDLKSIFWADFIESYKASEEKVIKII